MKREAEVEAETREGLNRSRRGGRAAAAQKGEERRCTEKSEKDWWTTHGGGGRRVGRAGDWGPTGADDPGDATRILMKGRHRRS